MSKEKSPRSDEDEEVWKDDVDWEEEDWGDDWDESDDDW